MKKRSVISIKIIALLLLLPLLGIAFAPPKKISAQCSYTGSQIKVEGGLISAVDVANFLPVGTDVNCISGTPAPIPQFSIQDYDQMKRDYFDQAKSTYNKITLPGPQTQSAPSSPINLISF